MNQGSAPGNDVMMEMVKEEPGRSDAKHCGRERPMQGRSRFERLNLLGNTLELVAHGWKGSRSLVYLPMMVHEQP
jgi:hypothetical protein